MKPKPMKVAEYFTPDEIAKEKQNLQNLAVMSFAEKVLAFEDGKIRGRLEKLGVSSTIYLSPYLPGSEFPSVAQAAAELNALLDEFDKTRLEDLI